jgi:mercuric ion transport protein|tara:strand:- start:2686 stop:3084 length:399 start_codon:yes stop_codon:yes gene_type:complete
MSTTESDTEILQGQGAAGDRKRTVFASGGVIGAILASTCCIVPLTFVMLGISGAWVGNLTALEPYKPLFASVALVFIGLGFRQVYFKERPSCHDGNYCGKPQSAIITKVALWVSTVVVLLALTINWWAQLFY